MQVFRFKNWKIYEDAKQLFSYIIRIVDKLPKEYRYSIGDQIIRSGLSIVLNIAEGSGRDSDKELNRYFNIVIGSINETLAVADIMNDTKLIISKEFDDLIILCESISKQIGGFKKKLKFK